MSDALDAVVLADDVLLALGRFTWLAINLEARTTRLCEKLTGLDRAPTGRPISGLIRNAQSVLNARMKLAARNGVLDTTAIVQAHAWLIDADREIQNRNAVLHSYYAPLAADPSSEVIFHVLLHFPPHTKSNDHPALVATTLTAEAFDQDGDRMSTLLNTWSAVQRGVAAAEPSI